MLFFQPVELAGVAVACELGIFKTLAEHNTPMSVSEVVKQTKGEKLLVERILRFLSAHGMVDQTEANSYSANRLTREYTLEYRVGSVFTM